MHNTYTHMCTHSPSVQLLQAHSALVPELQAHPKRLAHLPGRRIQHSDLIMLQQIPNRSVVNHTGGAAGNRWEGRVVQHRPVAM